MRIRMTEKLEREAARQSTAEHQDERNEVSTDTSVRSYQLVNRVVRSAPIAEPPAGFAAALAARLRDYAEQALLETWLVRIVLALAAAGIMAVVTPWFVQAHDRLAQIFAGTPWPMLLAVGILFAAIAFADYVLELGAGRKRSR